MKDAKTEEQPPQVTRFARLNRIEKILRRLFTHAFELQQLRQRELVKVCDVADETLRNELRHERLAAAFDVHGATRAEMFDAPAHLSRTVGIGAAENHLFAI